MGMQIAQATLSVGKLSLCPPKVATQQNEVVVNSIEVDLSSIELSVQPPTEAYGIPSDSA